MNAPPPIRKYPRTEHVESSRLQPGDEDLAAVPFREIRSRHLVVEEKIDGANTAISFDRGELLLQSRGHYLVGGAREKHFAPLKPWAQAHAASFHRALGERYVMYGEWVYAKHTVFYDSLPHYFLEFDVLDRTSNTFLSTPRRRALLAGLPIVSVPVVHEGTVPSLAELVRFVGPSCFKSSAWRAHLTGQIEALSLDPLRIWGETDGSDEMEGLYLKVEEDGIVTRRLKWVRPTFLTAVVDSGSHWLSRPIVPNQLKGGAALDALFAADVP